MKVSRGDIRRFAQSGQLCEAVAAALAWGYPRGMRGGYTNLVCSELDHVVELLQSIQGDVIDWRTHYSLVRDVPGVGLSTYSKFLAFLPITVEGESPLILDDVVCRVLHDGRFEELCELRGLRYDKAPDQYVGYLREMAAAARGVGATSEQVEMFLYAFGRNLKPAGS